MICPPVLVLRDQVVNHVHFILIMITPEIVLSGPTQLNFIIILLPFIEIMIKLH